MDSEAQVYLICAAGLLVAFVAAAVAAVRSLTAADREEQRRRRAEVQVRRLEARIRELDAVDAAFATAPVDPPAAPEPVMVPWAAPTVWTRAVRREHGGLW